MRVTRASRLRHKRRWRRFRDRRRARRWNLILEAFVYCARLKAREAVLDVVRSAINEQVQKMMLVPAYARLVRKRSPFDDTLDALREHLRMRDPPR